MLAPASAAVLQAYAERFDAVYSDGTHSVGSPLGAWLLLALVAPEARGTERDQIEAALGADVKEARRLAGALLNTPHPAVASALALWHRDEHLLPAFAEWMRTLPSATETGRVPTRAEADEWAHRTTGGLIAEFPLELDDTVAIVLADALATSVEWRQAFEVVPATELGGTWSDRVERVLGTPPVGHEMLIARTDRAGDVAVHAAESDDGLMVVSVIAEPTVAPVDVRAATHDVATMLVLGSSSTATRSSLFDLPVGDGHAWTIVERQVAHDDEEEPAREVYRSYLPAWTAGSTHDLLGAGAPLGFPVACRVLGAFVDPDGGPHAFDVTQVATAAYHRRGFDAAAITEMLVSVGFSSPARTVPQRAATMRFGRPYAVVAVALDPDGGPWHAVPVFSAWVAEPSESFDDSASGT
ncbi:MAG TPA: serpin family protein [Acidimicrobiia bacterium]|nr:serpin family protein [Acidimicrobiia bacterium]